MPERSPEAVYDQPGTPEINAAGPDLHAGTALLEDGYVPLSTEALPDDVALLEQYERDAGVYRKKLPKAFWVGAVWVLFVVALAALAPLFTENDQGDCTVTCLLKNPESLEGKKFLPAGYTYEGETFWLGTDQLGRDILSRLIWGARVSLVVGFASIAVGMFFGTIIGLAAGYYKGKVEGVLMGAMDVLLAFPPLLLALALISFRTDPTDASKQGAGLSTVIFAISILSVPPIARLVRANTLVHREREFVLASRTLGASNFRVIIRDILPNVLPPIVSFAVLGVAIAIVFEGALAILGLSVPAPTPSWGGMINDGKDSLLNGDPQVSLIPAFVMFLTVASLNLMGNGLREYFDVKETAI
ncbi:MAG: ABC transporter permease [Acidimicrobiales bacterium]|jgi:peptide/nickel transport system permease protein|nr:ABC transporter permease [Acidimicrobiales bacterium]